MQRTPLPSGLPVNFTTKAAKDAGISRSRLRASDLYPVFHGVRSQVDGSQLRDRLRSLMAVLPETAAFSHHTCAALLGIPHRRILLPICTSRYLAAPIACADQASWPTEPIVHTCIRTT